MKSENILMDEIVKIRRELKRIKKLKKKAKREKKLKKKTKRERVSTKYLTNPEQPKPQPIMVTNPNPQNDNLRQLSSEYLLHGQDLVDTRSLFVFFFNFFLSEAIELAGIKMII